MDMDAGRRRRFLLMLMGVVLALAAAGGVYVLGQGVNQPGQEIEMSDVLVATREVPARATVTPEDVEVRAVPSESVLAQAYRDSELVIGRVTAITVYPGQQITPNLFATSAADAPFDILAEDEEVTADSPYWRATSVSVPLARAVGGQVRAGQRVDLMVTVEFAQPFIPVFDPETGQVKYEQVPAIPAVNEMVDPETGEPMVDPETGLPMEPKDVGITSGRSTKISLSDLLVLQADPLEGNYVLKVTLHQAEQIAHINQVAPDAFSLVLRPEQDNRTFDPGQYGQTTDALIMEYVYKVPLLVDLEQLLGIPIEPLTPSPGQSPDPAESPEPEPEPEPEPTPTSTP